MTSLRDVKEEAGKPRVEKIERQIYLLRASELLCAVYLQFVLCWRGGGFLRKKSARGRPKKEKKVVAFMRRRKGREAFDS